jgi:hypothetical protein
VDLMSAAPLQGRCVAAITAVVSVDVAGERLGHDRAAIGVADQDNRARDGSQRHWSQRRRHQTVGEGLGLKELLDALALAWADATGFDGSIRAVGVAG